MIKLDSEVEENKRTKQVNKFIDDLTDIVFQDIKRNATFVGINYDDQDDGLRIKIKYMLEQWQQMNPNRHETAYDRQVESYLKFREG